MKPVFCLLLFVLVHGCNTPKKEKRGFQWALIVGDIYIDLNGDTVNRYDTENRKQGKWQIWREGANEKSSTSINSLESEGFYKNDKKEGYWITFSMYGDILDSVLYKNGVQQRSNPKTYTVN